MPRAVQQASRPAAGILRPPTITSPARQLLKQPGAEAEQQGSYRQHPGLWERLREPRLKKRIQQQEIEREVENLGEDEDHPADPVQAPVQVELAHEEQTYTDRQGEDQDNAERVGVNQDGVQGCLRNWQGINIIENAAS